MTGAGGVVGTATKGAPLSRSGTARHGGGAADATELSHSKELYACTAAPACLMSSVQCPNSVPKLLGYLGVRGEKRSKKKMLLIA